jgi:hypothetical protein
MNELIVVSASSDDVTIKGTTLVRTITSKSNLQCFDNRALDPYVTQILLSNPRHPVFFTGHGRPGFWRGTDGLPLVNSTTTSVDLFQNRIMFALACWTGCHLGGVAAKNGATYIGYNKAISVIPAGKKTAPIIKEFLSRLFSLIESLAQNDDIHDFEFQMSKLQQWGKRELFRLVHLHGIYIEAAVAVEEWGRDFLVHKKDHLSIRPPRLLAALTNSGSCAEECSKDGLHL